MSYPAKATSPLFSPPCFFLLKCHDLNTSVCILCLSAGRTQCGRLPEDGMCQPHSSHQTLLQGAVTNNDTANLLPRYISHPPPPKASHKLQPPHTPGPKHLKFSVCAPKVFSVWRVSCLQSTSCSLLRCLSRV